MTSIIKDYRPPGPDDRERELLHVLQRVWTFAITTKSDDARFYADVVAEGLSRGFLTTLVAYGENVYGRLLKVTVAGLQFLADNGERIAREEVENYVASYQGMPSEDQP